MECERLAPKTSIFCNFLIILVGKEEAEPQREASFSAS